jgi:hypothetical protein
VPRKALGGDSGDIRYPLVPPPLCHKINSDGSLEEGKAVPALEKIVSDNLPLNLAATDNRWNSPNNISLRDEMEQKYQKVRENLLNVRIERMKELIDLLLLCHNRIENPDYWETVNQGEAIRELVSTLSILALIGEIALDVLSKVLTGFLKEKFYIAVIDGKGTETQGSLQNVYKEYVETNSALNIGLNIDPEKNTLLVLCRHRGEQPINGIAQEIVGFTMISRAEESSIPQELHDEGKFTSMSGGRLFWHSRESLYGILEQNSLDEAKAKLEEKLAPLTN